MHVQFFFLLSSLLEESTLATVLIFVSLEADPLLLKLLLGCHLQTNNLS